MCALKADSDAQVTHRLQFLEDQKGCDHTVLHVILYISQSAGWLVRGVHQVS